MTEIHGDMGLAPELQWSPPRFLQANFQSIKIRGTGWELVVSVMATDVADPPELQGRRTRFVVDAGHGSGGPWPGIVEGLPCGVPNVDITTVTTILLILNPKP